MEGEMEAWSQTDGQGRDVEAVLPAVRRPQERPPRRPRSWKGAAPWGAAVSPQLPRPRPLPQGTSMAGTRSPARWDEGERGACRGRGAERDKVKALGQIRRNWEKWRIECPPPRGAPPFSAWAPGSEPAGESPPLPEAGGISAA